MKTLTDDHRSAVEITPLLKHWVFWVIVALGCLVRVAVAIKSGDATLDHEWRDIVDNMLNGYGFSYFKDAQGEPLPSAFMPPLYAVTCYIFVKFFGMSLGVLLLKLVQCLLFIPLAYFIADVTDRLFDRASVWIALILITLFPLSVYMPGQISTAMLTVFWYAMAFWCLYHFSVQRSWKWVIVLGVVFGIGALVRAEMLGYAGIFSWWLLITGWHGSKLNRAQSETEAAEKPSAFQRIKQPFLQAFALGMIVLVCIMPMAIRNTVIFKEPTMLTTTSGLNLWIGMNKYSTGFTRGHTYPQLGHPDSPWPDDPEMVAEIRAIPTDYQYEIHYDEIHMKYALRDMKADPARLPGWMLTKLGYFWVYPWTDKVHYPGIHHPAYWGPWLAMLPFILLGWALLLKRGGDAGIVTTWLLIQSLLVMVFFSMPRYRAFLLPFVIPLAAYAITWTWCRLKLTGSGDSANGTPDSESIEKTD